MTRTQDKIRIGSEVMTLAEAMDRGLVRLTKVDSEIVPDLDAAVQSDLQDAWMKKQTENPHDWLGVQVKSRDEVPGILPPHNESAANDVTEAVRKAQQKREKAVTDWYSGYGDSPVWDVEAVISDEDELDGHYDYPELEQKLSETRNQLNAMTKARNELSTIRYEQSEKIKELEAEIEAIHREKRP